MSGGTRVRSSTLVLDIRACSVTQSCPPLCDPWPVTLQAPLSMGSFRQGYWSGLPCPPPGDLYNPGIKPSSPVSRALQAESLPLSHLGSPCARCWHCLWHKTGASEQTGAKNSKQQEQPEARYRVTKARELEGCREILCSGGYGRANEVAWWVGVKQ